MTLIHLLAFAALALAIGTWVPTKWRIWVYFLVSLTAVYWLQSSTPIRNLDFWLPTASILLTWGVWLIVRHKKEPATRISALMRWSPMAFVLLVGATRYTGPFCCLTATTPPPMGQIAIILVGITALSSLTFLLPPNNRYLSWAAFTLIILIFVVLKTGILAEAASGGLRAAMRQDVSLASATDLQWLGISYLAFRLLHAIRDYQSGRLPAYSFKEFAIYSLFFPAYTSGPIDKVQRFVRDLRETAKLDRQGLVEGGYRILIGVFKKFALADSLAIFALNAQNASQIDTAMWSWVLLYAYSLRIYLDFSGYIDIALGISRWLDIRLPENFDRPYLKTDLTSFWNSWHITLAQWFRAYFFNPLTRYLRSKRSHLPVWIVILSGQFTTMLLIGLWHGLTWNFAIWGMWHGVGLFLHNRWSNWSKTRLPTWDQRPWIKRISSFTGWFITFHFVTLGWVWFALPIPGMALNTFQTLFGY
jgi:alginate O-acetyltransferase complex protein AlgI